MHDRLRALAPEYDLVVVGGGIAGAGVARDAALRGLRVALFEKDDFASGTSSRSSKLVHGGVRYLEHGNLRLVWEACHERQLLLHAAPHLLRPLPFVFPVFRDSRFGPGRLRLGMWLYDAMAAFRNVGRHRMLSVSSQARWGEGLRADGLRGAALYWDAAMDDARLVLANVLAARAAHAVTLNRVAVVRLLLEDGAARGVEVEDGVSGSRAIVRARVCVLCTGPWTNAFLTQVPGAPAPLGTTRGSHIVVRRLTERAFTLAAGSDGRVFFVLPWLGATLIGTTDLDDASDPDRVAPAEAEIEYLLAETNRHFPAAQLRRDDVRSAFAGLRPLLRTSGAASSRSREHALLEPVPGLVVVAGGKYTTYRAMASEVVDRIAARLGCRTPCRTARAPLPGGDVPWGAAEHWAQGPRFRAAARAFAQQYALELDTATHLLDTYGTRGESIAALVAADRSLATRLDARHPQVRAEVVHALRDEMALELEDWFWRRTPMAFAPDHGADAIDTVATLFAAERGWSAVQRDAAAARCRAALHGAHCGAR